MQHTETHASHSNTTCQKLNLTYSRSRLNSTISMRHLNLWIRLCVCLPVRVSTCMCLRVRVCVWALCFTCHCRVAHMNETCHAYKWDVSLMNESCHHYALGTNTHAHTHTHTHAHTHTHTHTHSHYICHLFEGEVVHENKNKVRLTPPVIFSSFSEPTPHISNSLIPPFPPSHLLSIVSVLLSMVVPVPVSVCYSVLQSGAVCYSMLQYVVVCCSVL